MYTTADLELPDPNEMAATGKRIYREKYQADFEARYPGKIVAIDLTTQQAFVAQSMREAGERGRKACPDSLFYFLKVGAPAVFTRR
jgi:hypothetical protein